MNLNLMRVLRERMAWDSNVETHVHAFGTAGSVAQSGTNPAIRFNNLLPSLEMTTATQKSWNWPRVHSKSQSPGLAAKLTTT